MVDLDSFETKVAEGHTKTEYVEPRNGRSERLGKVYVTPETKAILNFIGEASEIGGASGVAGQMLEELRKQGQLHQLWKSRCNRLRKANYHKKYG